MSIASWKRRFYPIAAAPFKIKYVRDWVPALEQAIRKWEGLNRTALARARVTHTPDSSNLSDTGGEVFPIDTDTCTLCRTVRAANAGRLVCADCPLNSSAVQIAALPEDLLGYGCNMPYRAWYRDDDPAPMLKLLRTARDTCADASPRKKVPKPLNTGEC